MKQKVAILVIFCATFTLFAQEEPRKPAEAVGEAPAEQAARWARPIRNRSIASLIRMQRTMTRARISKALAIRSQKFSIRNFFRPLRPQSADAAEPDLEPVREALDQLRAQP